MIATWLTLEPWMRAFAQLLIKQQRALAVLASNLFDGKLAKPTKLERFFTGI